MSRLDERFSVVLALVGATYVTWSLLEYDGWTAVAIIAIACATGVVGLFASGARSAFLRLAVVLAITAVALTVISAITDEDGWLSAASLLDMTLMLGAVLAILRRIVLTNRIGFEPILGAVSVYALLGIMFSFAYTAIHRIQDSPFFERVADPDSSDFVFFSYTTLTTTGYGNLVPDGQPGEMIAGLEMLVGQIFLVTLIARLVALWNPGERLRAARAARSNAPR